MAYLFNIQTLFRFYQFFHEFPFSVLESSAEYHIAFSLTCILNIVVQLASLFLVLDEADRILDMGFADTMNAIIENLPKKRQTLLFSATQTKSVKDLARLSLKNPEYVWVHEKAKYRYVLFETIFDSITISVLSF